MTARQMVSPYFVCLPDESWQMASTAVGAGTWPTANRAYYTPLRIPVTQRLASISVYCTTATGTVDIGLYSGDGVTRLASLGSTTAVLGRNTLTLATPILLEARKNYYLAMSESLGTNVWIRQNPAILVLRAAGFTQEASAHPLPATATPVQMATQYAPAYSLTFVT